MKYSYILILLMLSINFISYAHEGLHPRYHTYEEIKFEIDSLANEYPELVFVDSIGVTNTENIPIWAVKLSDNAAQDEDEPSVMYAGQCHAEEILGVEVTMWMINEILTNHNEMPYSLWLQEIEIWFVPSYNPEGLNVVTSGLDTSFRKNKTDVNNNGIFDFEEGPGNDIDGVDPNRNFSFNWVHGDTLYEVGGEEPYDYYRGAAPFSEGGSQAIRNLASQQHFIFSVNWHSSRSGNHSEKIHYSFKWNDAKECPDFAENQIIAETVASLIPTEAGDDNYEPSPSLSRRGHAHDWFYQAHGTTQLLIECGTSNIQPPPDIVDDTCERNAAGAYWMMNRVLGYQTDRSMLTGHIYDEVTNQPLDAEVIVMEKHASFFKTRKADLLYGRFWRFLLPGTYTLKIRKEGYEEKIIENVTVNNSIWTELEIDLIPLPEVEINGAVTSDGLPVDAEVVFYELENDTLSTTNGNFSYDTYAGDIKMHIYAEGYNPVIHEGYLEPGMHNLNFEINQENLIFQENWNNGFTNWQLEGDWYIVSHSNFSFLDDNLNEFYQNNRDKSLTLIEPVSIAYENAALIIEHKYHTEYDNDKAILQISDDGENWSDLREFSGKYSSWHKDFIALENYSGQDVYLRLHFTTDENCIDPGWQIKSLKLTACHLTDSETEFIEKPQLKLLGNYPNPFNPETKILFTIPENQKAQIDIFNIKGQKVKNLKYIYNKEQTEQSVIWKGTDESGKTVGSGVYFYKIKTDNDECVSKMLLMK